MAQSHEGLETKEGFLARLGIDEETALQIARDYRNWCSTKSGDDETGLREFPNVALTLPDRIKCHNFALIEMSEQST